MVEPLIDVSVIIATRDHPHWLGRCLDALARATAPATRVEVFVVDDGGETPLEAVLDNVRDRLDVTLVRQPTPQGIAASCNLGAEHASGRILAFTSEDCVPQIGWVEALLLASTQHPGSLIAGRTETASTANIFVRVNDAVTQHLHQWSSAHNVPPFAPIHNLALPRDRFEKIGGFRSAARTPRGEDRDLIARWAERGWPTDVAEQALIIHDRQISFVDSLRQHHRYGRGAYHFAQQLSDRGQDSRLFKGPRFYLVMLHRVQQAAGWWGLPAVALAQVLTAVGYLRERRRLHGGASDIDTRPPENTGLEH